MPLTKLVTLMVIGIDSKLFELIFYQKIFKQILQSNLLEVLQFEYTLCCYINLLFTHKYIHQIFATYVHFLSVWDC